MEPERQNQPYRNVASTEYLAQEHSTATACLNIDTLGFTTVFPGFKRPHFFADYSLMMISIDK